jgi:hypothetical protein
MSGSINKCILVGDREMQALRDKIYDAVQGWAKDELAQLDVKRMALHALSLSILDIEDEGETCEDLDAFNRT